MEAGSLGLAERGVNLLATGSHNRMNHAVGFVARERADGTPQAQ